MLFALSVALPSRPIKKSRNALAISGFCRIFAPKYLLITLSDSDKILPTPCTGPASCAFPEAKSSKTGASVSYTPAPDKHWYVFRITYNREQLAADYLIDQGIYAYLALGWKQVLREGKKKRILRPLFNMVFAYVTPDQADTFVHDTPLCPFITYYYDHFTVGLDYRNPPLTIPAVEMQSFIRATCLQDPHVMAVDPERCNFLSDEEVLVTDGPFAGVRGRVVRVSRQNRIAVSLRGISTLIVTAYIPTAFLEKVSQ